MQTQNPFLDEMAKLSTAAMGLAQAAGDEVKAAARAQADRMVAELDLIRREDFEVLKTEIASLRAEVAALKAAQKPGANVAAAAPKAAPKAAKSKPKAGG